MKPDCLYKQHLAWNIGLDYHSTYLKLIIIRKLVLNVPSRCTQDSPHQATLNTVDKMGKDHDTELLEWVEELKSTIYIEQVIFYCDAILTCLNVICSS